MRNDVKSVRLVVDFRFLISKTIPKQLKLEDMYKTAWTLPRPFGLTNVPRTFQRILNKVLEGLIGITCFCYINDIIIFSKTKEKT